MLFVRRHFHILREIIGPVTFPQASLPTHVQLEPGYGPWNTRCILNTGTTSAWFEDATPKIKGAP